MKNFFTKFKELSGIRSRSRELKPGWTGVDLNDGLWGISVRSAATPTGKPVVVSFSGTEQSFDAESIRAALGVLREPGFGTTAVLQNDDYQLFLVERPAVRTEEMAQSLTWTLDARVDYPAAEASLAWFNLPTHESLGNRSRQIYLVSARKALIDERVRLLEEGTNKIDAVDIRETSRRNLAGLIEERDGNGVCLIVAESGGIQITVTFGGELYLERFIREKVLEPKPGDDDAKDRQFDRIALELQRTLDFLRRNFPFISVGNILVAPLPTPVDLQSGLASRLSEPIKSLDLTDYVDFPPGSPFDRPEVQAHYVTALGAALRYRDSVVE